jgi:hypothetical protein
MLRPTVSRVIYSIPITDNYDRIAHEHTAGFWLNKIYTKTLFGT